MANGVLESSYSPRHIEEFKDEAKNAINSMTEDYAKLFAEVERLQEKVDDLTQSLEEERSKVLNLEQEISRLKDVEEQMAKVKKDENAIALMQDKVNEFKEVKERAEKQSVTASKQAEAANAMLAVAEARAKIAEENTNKAREEAVKWKAAFYRANGKMVHYKNAAIVKSAPEEMESIFTLLDIIAARAGYGSDIQRLATHYGVTLPEPILISTIGKPRASTTGAA